MKALVLGAGGFIGSHLVKRLKSEGYFVKGIDLKFPEFSESHADEFVVGDLRNNELCIKEITRDYDEVYQLAADMGGAGYLFTGENDYDVMHNSALINLNVSHCAISQKIKNIFYSSSACIYPKRNQTNPNSPLCIEDSVYPADPDSEYGWEKLFSERVYLSAIRNYGLNAKIARFHNVYGPEGTWDLGKEKAPAAICRKVAKAIDGGEVEVWGDGTQTRSFLYIDDCLDGIRKLMQSDYCGPVNIGSEEMVTINGLTEMVMQLSEKKISIKHIEGPIGVMGRNSDNTLVKEMLNWEPKYSLRQGMEKTYHWINGQVQKSIVSLV